MLQLIDKYGNVYGEGPIIVTTKDGKLKTNVTTSTAWGSITGILSNQTDLQSALNAKQATLVSGTNIKTINGSSILGSGNLVITGGVSSVSGVAPIASSGGATPSISIATANTSTTGAITSIDWNRFNAKQNALTLTTTGSSGPATLVGSTLNIPQYSGGSSSSITGIHAVVPPSSGAVLSSMLTTTGYASTTQVANRMILYPFLPVRNVISQNLFIRVATAQAGSSAQIVIYNDLNGMPYNLLAATGSLDCSTIGNKTFVNQYPFYAGYVYWIGIWTSGTQSVFTMPSANMLHIRSMGATPAPSCGIAATITYGPTPPAIAPTFGTTNQNMPFVGITEQ